MKLTSAQLDLLKEAVNDLRVKKRRLLNECNALYGSSSGVAIAARSELSDTCIIERMLAKEKPHD